jgi:hypothetical protein
MPIPHREALAVEHELKPQCVGQCAAARLAGGLAAHGRHRLQPMGQYNRKNITM